MTQYLESAGDVRNKTVKEQEEKRMERLFAPIRRRISEASAKGEYQTTIEVSDNVSESFPILQELSSCGYHYQAVAMGCGHKLFSIRW